MKFLNLNLYSPFSTSFLKRVFQLNLWQLLLSTGHAQCDAQIAEGWLLATAS
jgi:hypothetical protein